MEDEKGKQERDDLRCEAAVQTIKDILWRFEESHEGTRSTYDIIGFVIEDVLKEGFCGACMNEAITAAFNSSGVDPTIHKEDDSAVFH